MRIRLNKKTDAVEVELPGATGRLEHAATVEKMKFGNRTHVLRLHLDAHGFIRRITITGLAKFLAELTPDENRKGNGP